MESESYAETSSDDDFLTDSSLAEESDNASLGSDYRLFRSKRKRKVIHLPEATGLEHREENVNLLRKLWNRESTGHFSGNLRCSQAPRAFSKVPKRLGFCLKDIIPCCYLQGHMFMGLSACGQFMLSYKVCFNDNIGSRYYTFNIDYKYTLYFWVYQPHRPFRRYFKTCLFDDHGVDNLKEVSMAQWKTTQRQVLIVHGAAENENEDSYITYVKVPKLGCLECKKLHECEDDGFFRSDALCLKCNLTIHTKYSPTETDPKFKPHINLLCPERILIIANGFVHMLHIELESSPSVSQSSQSTQHSHLASPHHNHPPAIPPQHATRATSPHESTSTTPAAATDRRLAEETIGCDNQNNIVARIIADFSDIETDSTHSVHSSNNDPQRSSNNNEANSSQHCVGRKSYDELIFTCQGNSKFAAAATSFPSASVSSSGTLGSTAAKVNLASHRGGRRHHRIVTKSYRNGVTTVDLQASSTSSLNTDKASAYEFSEDNEKCEKIATFRKRRLADKKYEFSEDNSENIVPFTKIRSAPKQALTTALFGSPSSPGGCGLSTARALHRAPTSSQYSFLSSPYASPSSSPRPSHSSFGSGSGGDVHVFSHTPSSMQRTSPIGLGFLSPPTCGSPVGAGVMRSPGKHIGSGQFCQQKSPPLSQATQQMLSFKPLTTLSPLQVSVAKRSHFEMGGHMSPNANVPFLSPRREEYKVIEVPLQGGLALEKPICTKKFKRRYVEEDEATSVITSEEDDCISPGYHTSLPMEVHGSCYSEMQMISQASYQQLRHCASVVITQHSFDLETFSYYVTSKLCQKNNKIYDVFYDWAYELISVCPHSNSIVCMLIVQFVVRDPQPCTKKTQLLSFQKTGASSMQHRKPCECRILFTWNMESGDWEVLDYGELVETSNFDVVTPTTQQGKSAGLNLATTARKLARELKSGLSKMPDYSQNLRVLDSNLNKSKLSLTDLDNTLEFYLKRPRYND